MARRTHSPVLACLVAIAVAVVVSGCGGPGGSGGGESAGGDVVARASAATGDSASEPGGDRAGSGLVVDVAGMVRTPGVYELPRGARVHDAISAAGGTRPGAVLTGLNRAAEVVDGQQVLVPAAAAANGTASVAGAVSGAKVSINSADVAALDELPGIGPVTAQRIVEDRAANGPFADVADLGRVPGIGAATIADLESRVTP